MFDDIKQKIKKLAVNVGIPIAGVTLVVGGLIGGLIESGDNAVSASAASAEDGYSDYSDLGDYIVKTDEDGAIPALTKEQLKTAVDKHYSGGSHDNYINQLDSFISIQDKYKVNAAFAVAVAQIESTGGTGWDLIDPGTYNWYSIKGSIGGGYKDRNGESWNKYTSFANATEEFGKLIAENYFNNGKITVENLGTIYCETPTDWSEAVKKELDDMYSAVGVETNTANDTSTVSGNTFKNNKGRTFLLYNQNNFNDDYGGQTIAASGCGLTSLTMCISGYGNKVDPPSVAKKCLSKFPGQYTYKDGFGSAGNGQTFKNYLSLYGLTGECYGGYDTEKIKKHLESGNPVIINVQNASVWNQYYRAHYITVLGSRNNGKEFYLGDPGGGRFAWIKPSDIGGCVGYCLVSKK